METTASSVLKSQPVACLTEEAGATAIEYAFILPVLVFLLMGIVEYCLVMYASSVVDGATVYAAREGKTGYIATGLTRQQYIYGLVQSRASGLLTAANFTISSKSYGNFSDIGQPEPFTDVHGLGYYVVGDPYVDINGNGQWDADQGAVGLGGAGDIVVYTVTYPWHINTPFLQNIIGTNGTFNITASAVVKNEPYNTTTPSR